MRPILLSGFLLVSCAWSAPASAQTTLDGVGWQLALQVSKQRRNYHDIKQWLFPPSGKLKARPRVLVTLKNSGDLPENAMLLTYGFSARLRPIGKEGPGRWTVPFLLEERRVPRVKAGVSARVPLYINRVALRAYLSRMYRAGFWPDAFKVGVLLEPRDGETLEDRFIEDTLEVIWKASSAGGRDER